MARERDALLRELTAVNLDTPDWLWRRWVAAYGEATAWKIAEAHWLEPSLDLSVKSDPAGWAEKLGGIVLPTGTVRLDGPAADRPRPSPATPKAQWWVQDAAAAFPRGCSAMCAGKRVADLCAAPGGKTAALAAAGAMVTAVDISAPRLERLAANLKRLGLTAETVAADVLEWQAARCRIRRRPPRRALHRDRHHPPPPRRRLAEAGGRRRRAGQGPGENDRPRRRDAEARRHARLLHLLARARGRRSPARRGPEAPALTLAVPVAPAEIGGLAEVITPAGTIRTLPTHLANPVARLSGLDGFFIMRLREKALSGSVCPAKPGIGAPVRPDRR